MALLKIVQVGNENIICENMNYYTKILVGIGSQLVPVERDPRFEFIQRQILFTINCNEKMKIKKEAGNGLT